MEDAWYATIPFSEPVYNNELIGEVHNAKTLPTRQEGSPWTSRPFAHNELLFENNGTRTAIFNLMMTTGHCADQHCSHNHQQNHFFHRKSSLCLSQPSTTTLLEENICLKVAELPFPAKAASDKTLCGKKDLSSERIYVKSFLPAETTGVARAYPVTISLGAFDDGLRRVIKYCIQGW